MKTYRRVGNFEREREKGLDNLINIKTNFENEDIFCNIIMKYNKVCGFGA